MFYTDGDDLVKKVRTATVSYTLPHATFMHRKIHVMQDCTCVFSGARKSYVRSCVCARGARVGKDSEWSGLEVFIVLINNIK